MLENDARSSEDKAAKAMTEVARLMAELNSANESALNADRSRALLAKQIADLQAQLEHAEMEGGKGYKNQIRKLEQRVSKYSPVTSLAKTSYFFIHPTCDQQIIVFATTQFFPRFFQNEKNKIKNRVHKQFL